jgi:hypothetical protein
VTTVEEDRTQARIDGLVQVLRDAEADFRRSYARVLDVVAELDAERAGAVAGFGTTALLLAGVLNLSKSEAKARAEQAGLLAPRQSLTGQMLLESQLGAVDVTLSSDVLDQIDEIIPPGVTLARADTGYLPPALQDPSLRRRCTS